MKRIQNFFKLYLLKRFAEKVMESLAKGHAKVMKSLAKDHIKDFRTNGLWKGHEYRILH